MNIYEFQGKKILRKFNINTPKGINCTSKYEAIKAIEYIGGKEWVMKAQIFAGGRGKNNGIKIVKSIKKIEKYMDELLYKKLITNQTSEKGEKVSSILIEEKIKFKEEFYVSILTNRTKQKVSILLSQKGGIKIEETFKKNPELIYKINVSPYKKIKNSDLKFIINKINTNKFYKYKIKKLIKRLYKVYLKTDCLLLEINPFVITKNGNLIILDVKFNFDDNALFRQKEILKYQNINKKNKNEIKLSKMGMSYISLNGNIGCLVNGAGLAMATMDSINFFGGNPANFFDIGGKTNTENIAKSFKIMLKNKKIKVILVNIFGGIIKCNTISNGLIKISKIIDIKIPIVIRMKGTNEYIGKNILYNSNLKIILVDNIAEAAKKSVILSHK